MDIKRNGQQTNKLSAITNSAKKGYDITGLMGNLETVKNGETGGQRAQAMADIVSKILAMVAG